MKRIIQRVAALVIGLGLGAVALAGLESVTHISDLNSSWPLGSDLASTSDDHIRNIKVALKTDFPNITGPVTVTQAQLNAVGASGVTGKANPSASVGLTAVNGTATTVMRSDGAPALDQSIVPTWTGTHSFTGAVSTTTSTSQVSIGGSGGGSINVFAGSAAANQKAWDIRALTAGTLDFRSVNDAYGSATDWMLVSKGTGAAVGSLAFGNATDNPTYTFLGTGIATFSGQVTGTLSGGASSSAFYANSGGPSFGWRNSGAAADAKLWDFVGDSATTLTLRAVSDSLGAAKNGIRFTRSGISITDVSFGNATDNPTYTFLGTGAITGVGSGLTSLNGSNVSSGTVAAARLGSGTANSTTFLRGDNTWQTVASTTTGTFTGTFTGFTAGVTATCTWTLTGNTATVFIPATAQGTSNANTFTMTGLPAAIQPATLTQAVAAAGSVVSNNVSVSGVGAVFQAASGTVLFQVGGGGANWAASGLKGFNSVGSSFTYSVQ